MAKSRKGLANDYRLLDMISKELLEHERRIMVIGKNVARKKIRTDLEDGMIENLDIVLEHMDNARKEIERAKKKLRMI